MPANQYLGYVHSFRGFAILNIVAIHSFVVAMIVPTDLNPDKTSPMFILNETLFHDSTIYFAVISGLLFSVVLRSKGYQRFFTSKIRNVLLPYAFCTVVFSALRWNTDGTGILALAPDLSDYLHSIPPNLLNGEAQFTFWYIPVLLIIFVLTPLLASIVQAKSPASYLVWIVLLLPLYFSRPPFGPGISQVTAGAVIYFAGAYTAGLYLGDNLERCLGFIRKYRGAIFAVAMLSSIAIVTLQFKSIDRFGSFSLQESLYYVQKLCLGGLVLLWLKGRAENQPRWLAYFADAAFSIYFLHAFFILLLAHFLWDFLHIREFLPWTIYLMGPVYIAFALAMSMLVVKALQAILGKNSRLVIGS